MLLAAVIVGSALLLVPTVLWYWRRDGLATLRVRDTRHRELQSIWSSLDAFKKNHGRYPVSNADWSADGDVKALLTSATTDLSSSYSVEFELLDCTTRVLVVRFPGSNIVPSGTRDSWPNVYSDLRLGLFNDGTIEP